ncbi:beta-propeller domain-containing protein [Haloarculaceae archaeon H-GB2-1]|nr:beta-propeller domain-containing protein [Haloarculaceae archaeon H-GB1-1]MEA5388987.1 beta-propeller domain-containing protein [Haloarculaceae archaeon H-GB11]MEA5407045.1 beta-propeller domain-containing protein [Haloarculaceae archaeon H-GB2-1]
MSRSKTSVLVVVALLVGSLFGAGVAAELSPPAADDEATDDSAAQTTGIDRFEGEQAFREYLRAGQQMRGATWVNRNVAAPQPTFDVQRGTAAPTATETVADSAEYEMTVEESADAAGGDGGEPRYSGTNVQEVGLDEPDVVKGDGETFYYADVGRTRVEKLAGGRTTVISADDPAAPAVVGNVSASGKLLLANDTLVVLGEDRVRGFDVSDRSNPERLWNHAVTGEVVSARLSGGQLYLVTRTAPSLDDPCPVEPLGGALSVACEDVYRPTGQIPADATYTAASLSPADGSVTDSVSFVGTRSNSVVYMSKDSLYVTYTEPSERGDLYVEYLLANASLPSSVVDRLQTIQSYDISSDSKRREARLAVHRWLATLPEDERETERVRLENGFEDYLAAHQRDLARTGVVRVDVDHATGTMSVDEVGTVPGTPLNQFSMDEHDGHLRITTTIPRAGKAESANDLYVLDAEDMDVEGATRGMGLNERVYSVRYVEDTAYVVTFRRVDPFHVVDLSDPSDPEVKGKLKLPGFSSYLHPVNESYVLGIGRDGGSVKAVLFDVRDPTNPTVADDFHLDGQWSAVSQSHHAFLLDRKHDVFFLPTRRGGYVVSYAGGDLSLQTAVTVEDARRARYVGDYLYVFGARELAVVNETTWNRTATVRLD